jgi:hypothetical protein
MNRKARLFRRTLPFLGMALVTVFLTTASSCDDEDFDRVPPEGQGSIIIDNNTSDDVRFFLDGVLIEEIDDDRKKGFDFDPGTYRVVLEQDGGDQNFRDDIDVLEGRLTILDVAFGFGVEYDVLVFFE